MLDRGLNLEETKAFVRLALQKDFLALCRHVLVHSACFKRTRLFIGHSRLSRLAARTLLTTALKNVNKRLQLTG